MYADNCGIALNFYILYICVDDVVKASRTPSRSQSRPNSRPASAAPGGHISRPGSAMGGGARPLSAVSMSDSFVAQYDLGDQPPISAEKRLLCVMSNCLYVRRHLAPRIASRVSELGIGELDQAFDDTLRGLEDLDAQCFRALLGQKGGLMSNLIQEGEPKRFGRQAGSKKKVLVPSAWETIPTSPQEVRRYVKEVLLHMVVVHADVTACSRPFVTRVVSALLVRISRDFGQMVRKIAHFGENSIGAEQLLLEVHVMKSVLQAFDKSPVSVWEPVLTELISKLPAKHAAVAAGAAASGRASSPASSPAAGRKRGSRGLPTPGGGGAAQPTATSASASTSRRGSRGLPTPGGGRSLPSPGRALPAPGGEKGGRSLPSPGRTLPTPGAGGGGGGSRRRALPAPSAAGGRASGGRALPKPGASATPPGSPARSRRASRQLPGASSASVSTSASSTSASASSSSSSSFSTTASRRRLAQSDFATPSAVPQSFAPLLMQFSKRSAFQIACFLEAPADSGQEISEEAIDSFDRVDDYLDNDLVDEAAPEVPLDDSSEDEFL